MDTRTFKREIEMVEFERRIVDKTMATGVIHWRTGIDNRLLDLYLGLHAGVVEV